MRNPLRLKNLKLRFLPYYVIGGAILFSVRPTPATYGAGASLVVLGALMRTWGAGHLVKNDQLAITGPYAWLRHPLYVGTLLTATGFAVILGGWLSLAVIAFVLPWFFFYYFPRKDESESERLAKVHGGDFQLYRENVPALLPAQRPWHPAPGSLLKADSTMRWSGRCYSDNNEFGTLLAQLTGLVFLAFRTLPAV
jgi:protein-S-isoprenylcysteine O-methyltransferase Ste14